MAASSQTNFIPCDLPLVMQIIVCRLRVCIYVDLVRTQVVALVVILAIMRHVKLSKTFKQGLYLILRLIEEAQ